MQVRARNYVPLALGLILLLAAALRFYGLAAQSLWNDELATFMQSNRASIGEVVRVLHEGSIHPPGHNILIYLLIRYVGSDEIILRLPSAFAGVASVFAIFWLGRDFYGEQEGLIAALFTAVLWAPVYYSQELRAYSFNFFCATATTYFLRHIIRGLENNLKPSKLWPHFAAYIALSIFASYLHYFGLLLVALQGIGMAILFIHKRQTFIYVLALYIPIVVAYLPWVPALLRDQQSNAWIASPEQTALWSYLLFIFSWTTILRYIAPALLAYWLLHTLYNLFQQKRYQQLRQLLLSSDLFLVAWLIIPILFTFVFSKLSTSIFTNRNLLIAAPAAYILLARAITQLPTINSLGKNALALLLAAAFLFNLLFNLNYYTTPQKQQVRDVVAYIIEREAQYVDVLVVGYFRDWYNYYFEQLGSKQRIDFVAESSEYGPAIADKIAEKQPQYVWLLTYRAIQPNRQEFLSHIYDTHRLLEEHKFARGQVWLFERR